MEFKVRVLNGLPCIAKVTYYQPEEKGTGYGEVFSYSQIHAPVSAEVEFEIYDRRGYRAKWIENRMTEEDYESVRSQIFECLQDSFSN